MFGRKPKSYEPEMISDPDIRYQVGRLVGACDLAAHLLSTQESPDVRVIGEHLRGTVAWFYYPDDGVRLPVPAAAREKAAEQTAVLPPMA